MTCPRSSIKCTVGIFWLCTKKCICGCNINNYIAYAEMLVTIQSMEFSRLKYWSGQPFPSPGDLPNLGIEPRSPTLQVDSLPAEPQGKPKNTGVGSLSFLQWIFLTQESNWGLLHCRWILYQLSYKGAQEYWSGQSILSPVDLPDPGIELGSPALQANSLPPELSGKPKL